MSDADQKPDELETRVVTPPAPEWIEGLAALYRLWDRAHADGAWAEDLRRRLSSRQTDSIDTFYITPYHEQVAAALDVTRSERFNGLGVVHRVFAHKTQRRRGLTRRLLERAKAEFRDTGGRLLILAAPESGPARKLYTSLGFSEVTRAADGEILFGWAARGRHVREAALRFMKHEPVSWRKATPGDWASLLLYSSLPGGRPNTAPETLRDVEWIDVLKTLEADPPRATLELGESRHGYVVAVRGTGELPDWLRALASS